MSGLHVHRAERADVLVRMLAEMLREPPDDPFVAELVAVPARGVERWVTQRLSHHLGTSDAAERADGVCANISFPAPTQLVGDAVAAAGGYAPDTDPWAPGRLLWALLDVVDDCAGEAWCAVLDRHLRSGTRRMVTAQHLTRLFTSYADQRPSLLLDWATAASADGAGTDAAHSDNDTARSDTVTEDTATDDTDGAGSPLPEDLGWQAQLWRRLRERLDVSSPAERLSSACAALRADPGLADLPGRFSLFGPTRLTRGQVSVLAALAEHREVHLWLSHPSAALWDRVGSAAPGPRAEPTEGGSVIRRRSDPTAAVAGHRLLSSLGRDAREMQLLLTGCAEIATDTYHPPPEPAPTLLGRVQRGLRADQPPPGRPLGEAADTRPLLDPADRSIQVHACHGRSRQVEVLREVLLGLMASDPTLEPRDVLVMCPDIETYAPLVSATFGLADGESAPVHPGHRLRVRLADRALRQTNPLLATLAQLIELADGRLTASQVLDLAALPPVSHRFGFRDADLDRLRDWVGAAGVRWGIDADHRAPYELQTVGQGTWSAGLDRLLLGAAMAEDDLRWLGLALPLDDVDSTDVDLAGRLAELVDRLADVLDQMATAHPLTSWLDVLAKALDALTKVPESQAWQLTQARRELAEVAGQTTADTSPLSLADVRALLADRLAGRPTRANFRTGNLTMCSMVPMRSVPHRVICLLGLDDGVFPRAVGTDGDDVLARDPLVGERDRRSEDRQLLLDAVLAAKEHLVVLYTGADERTNTPRPPAVPLGEILDVIDDTVRTGDGRRARVQVVVRQPLQPFDARNFTSGALGADGPFSFDAGALAGAVAATKPRATPAPFLAQTLAPPEETAVELDALVRFLEHPVRGFLRQRLGVGVPEEGEDLDDALHPELGGLETWGVGDQWLHDRLSGADLVSTREAAWRRGIVPPGALGQLVLDEVAEQAEQLVTAAAADRAGPARSADIRLLLSSGRELRGTVGSLHEHTVSRVEYGTLKPKHRLKAWIQLLALGAAWPDEPWGAATVGRGKAKVMRSTLALPPCPAAMLEALVYAYDLGRRAPLPLPSSASCDYADRRKQGASQQVAAEGAAKAWKAAFEHTDAHHAIVWGVGHPFASVLAQRPAADEAGVFFDEPEATRFGAWSCRLWLPMLQAETLAAA